MRLPDTATEQNILLYGNHYRGSEAKDPQSTLFGSDQRSSFVPVEEVACGYNRPCS